LGKFLSGRRDKVAICTKFGVPRPVVTPLMRLLKPAARAMAKALPHWGSRKAKTKRIPNKDRLHAEHIEASVIESLRRLRTDYIDVLALDDPNPQDCINEAVLHELRRIIQKGYVRCVAIAGTPEAIIAGARAPDVYKIAQLPDNPFSQMVVRVKDALAGDAKLFFVTHSVFGAGALGRLSHLLGWGRWPSRLTCFPARLQSAVHGERNAFGLCVRDQSRRCRSRLDVQPGAYRHELRASDAEAAQRYRPVHAEIRDRRHAIKAFGIFKTDTSAIISVRSEPSIGQKCFT